MKVTQQFTQEEVERAVREGVKRRVDAITRDLQYAGEEVVAEARTGVKTNGKDYLTQTGNLRSSIGYVITYQGETIGKGGFVPQPGTESGEKGAEIGREVAKEVAIHDGNREALKLTVVAGMDYASPLSAKGYDVLDSAELKAKEKVDEIKRVHGI